LNRFFLGLLSAVRGAHTFFVRTVPPAPERSEENVSKKSFLFYLSTVRGAITFCWGWCPQWAGHILFFHYVQAQAELCGYKQHRLRLSEAKKMWAKRASFFIYPLCVEHSLFAWAYIRCARGTYFFCANRKSTQKELPHGRPLAKN
jgi:hypothetical protein